MERSHRPRSGELMRIIASLVSHVGRVRRCQRLADEGIRPRDAAPRLKMHPFAAEKAFAQAANFSAEELGDALVRLVGARRGGEGRLAAAGRSRARARARRRDAPRDARRSRATSSDVLARGEAGGLRLAAGGGVLVERRPWRRPGRAS